MLQLSDTTLRDGAQAEGITFSLDDKKQIVRALDELGVAWIEAGNPGANPLDEALFESLRQEPPLRHAHLTAFGSTRRPGIRPEEDEALVTLGRCGSYSFALSSAFALSTYFLPCFIYEKLLIINLWYAGISEKNRLSGLVRRGAFF